MSTTDDSEKNRIAFSAEQALDSRPRNFVWFWNIAWLGMVVMAPLSSSDSILNWGLPEDWGVFWGALLFWAGTFVRIFTRSYERWGQEFVCRGFSRYLRNPVQLGTWVRNVGILLWINTPLWFVAFLSIFSFVVLTYYRSLQELRLLKKFGTVFVRYQQRTSLWIPSWIPQANRTEHAQRLSLGFRRELKELPWTVLLLAAFALRVQYFGVTSIFLKF